jgi:beta-lactamase superfamily II metal-dependent hydrolase
MIGFWYLYVFGILLWSCSSKLPDPQLGSLLPRQGFENRATEVEITGKYFPENIARMALRSRDKRDYELQDLRRISDTTLQAVVSAKTPVGEYDLYMWVDGIDQAIVLGGAFDMLPNALIIYVIDVDQGDATLLLSPGGESMLIDAGTAAYADRIDNLLTQLGIRQIDHLLATHHHKDHVEGFERVVNGPDNQPNTADDRHPRKAIWDRGGSVSDQAYRSVRERYKDLHRALTGDTKDSFPYIKLEGDVSVKVMATSGKILTRSGAIQRVDCGSDENCRSIGTLVSFGDFRFWTGGDLTGGGNTTADVESLLADQFDDLIDVYNVHHHGSNTSSNEKFLQKLKPQVAIVSAGKDNSHCHPNAELLDRLLKLPKLYVLVTTEGLVQTTKCGSQTTRQRLDPIGTRAVVNAGNVRIVAERNRFSIKLSSSQEFKWDTHLQSENPD